MASADFLQFVVTAASEPNLPPSARPPLVLTHSFSPCNCLIYWQRFRTAIGREIVWHPCPRCLPYEIPVRQFRDLPAPSFRFHLAVDTLGVRLYPSRCRADSGLSPVGTCARRAQSSRRLPPVGATVLSHHRTCRSAYGGFPAMSHRRGPDVVVFGRPFVDKRSEPSLAFRATRGSAATVMTVLCAFPNARLTATSSY